MLYLFLQSVLPTVPASFLTFAERPIYHFYETVPHPWIDALTDNRIAGLTMKLGGGALLWGIIAVLFFKWHAAEEPNGLDTETWDDFERKLEAWNLRT
jgi:putative membrane protein